MPVRRFCDGKSLVVCLLLASSAHAQQVAHEKYRLANGMTVILHEDHSLPLACVNIWYRVGSKDEISGRSGFAHLFEHLMFMGTERVPGSDFDNLMEAGGGFNNASTSEDRTNYFSMGPSELLPTFLWLDADRLEDLGRFMSQEKLDKQRDVVRNERRQSYENEPYGKAALRVYELMYPDGHPYHIPVIGTHEDLEAATVADVQSFFATYYVPSNASLVVAGDFDPAVIKPLIERLFGTLPRGSDVIHRTAEPVQLTGVVRNTMTDAVQYARTSLVYHSPAGFQPGDAEMDLTAAVLASGISSRLYQKLIYENDLAVDVTANQSSMLLGSLFYIEATAKPGVSLDTLEAAIDETIAEFLDEGPSVDELERQKSRIEFRMVARLQSLLAKADRLNEYEFQLGEPDSFKRDLDRYRTATPQEVRRWARQVLKADARLILRVIPELPRLPENPRDARPLAMEAGDFTPPEPETFKLSNGITVHHWRKPELPLMAIRLLFHGGAALDGPKKAGLAELTFDMLDEGAGKHGAVEFADALDQLGANIRTTALYDATYVDLTTLTRNLDSALELFADAVLRPRLDPKEWERVQRLHVDQLVQLLDEPAVVASWVSQKAYYGDDHPYSRPTVGTPDTAKSLTLSDVKFFHAQLVRPSRAVLLAAGDMPGEALRMRLEEVFSSWSEPKSAIAIPEPAFEAPANRSLQVAIVDRPDAVQTVIRFIMPGVVYGDSRRIPLSLFNTILGGSFTSRLNQNLREKHGYTYGARSSYTTDPAVGYFTAGSSVRADVTGAALKEFLAEFAAIRKGDVTKEEAGKARSTQKRDLMESFEGLSGTLAAASMLIRNSAPFSSLADELSTIDRMDDNALNAMARDAVPLENALLVLVGDKELVMEQIKDLGLPHPVELSVTGAPVGTD